MTRSHQPQHRRVCIGPRSHLPTPAHLTLAHGQCPQTGGTRALRVSTVRISWGLLELGGQTRPWRYARLTRVRVQEHAPHQTEPAISEVQPMEWYDTQREP